ncbi:hypothetical protein GQ457_15G012650 [Hibiscus cannabinus]
MRSIRNYIYGNLHNITLPQNDVVSLPPFHFELALRFTFREKIPKSLGFQHFFSIPAQRLLIGCSLLSLGHPSGRFHGSFGVSSDCLVVVLEGVRLDIAIVSWNVKGLGKSETIWTLKFLIDKHRPSVFFLSETKQHGKYLERKRVWFKYTNSHYVHPCGIGG